MSIQLHSNQAFCFYEVNIHFKGSQTKWKIQLKVWLSATLTSTYIIILFPVEMCGWATGISLELHLLRWDIISLLERFLCADGEGMSLGLVCQAGRVLAIYTPLQLQCEEDPEKSSLEKVMLKRVDVTNFSWPNLVCNSSRYFLQSEMSYFCKSLEVWVMKGHFTD